MQPTGGGEHTWVAATTVELTERKARLALVRGSTRLPESSRLRVQEVYCVDCRRPYEDVHGEPCIAADNNEHLRGGPIGERKKRKGGGIAGVAQYAAG